jgi:hypothetical protein
MKFLWPKALLLTAVGLVGTAAVPADPEQEQQIAAIRKLLIDINVATNLSRSTVNIDALTSEGGSMEVYREPSGAVRKLVVAGLGYVGRDISEYYLENEQLRFLYQRVEFYNRPMTEVRVSELRIASSRDQRFYFVDGKLIRWLDSKVGEVLPAEPGFEQREAEIREYFGRLREFWGETGDWSTETEREEAVSVSR